MIAPWNIQTSRSQVVSLIKINHSVVYGIMTHAIRIMSQAVLQLCLLPLSPLFPLSHILTSRHYYQIYTKAGRKPYPGLTHYSQSNIHIFVPPSILFFFSYYYHK
jgi:hypothetical protein